MTCSKRKRAKIYSTSISSQLHLVQPVLPLGPAGVDEHLVDEEANTDLHISYARVHTAHQAPDMAVGFRGSDRYFIQKYEAQAYRWDEEAEMWVPDESNLSEILN